MATFRISIFNFATLPDTSGNVWFEPFSILQTNKRYSQMIARFKDTSTKDSLGFRFDIPNNYVSAPVFEVQWATVATTGNAIWTCDYSSGLKTASLDPSADEESLTVTTAAPGSTLNGGISRMSATAANIAANDIWQGKFSRNGAGSDTIAADLAMVEVIFEYADA